MSSTATFPANRIAASLINELKNEIKATRECLERIPEDKFDWKPHEKSTAMGPLAVHVADMFGWTKSTLQNSELDFAKMDFKPFEPATTAELVLYFDEKSAEALAALENVPDAAFMENWSLRNGEKVYFTLPKVAVMRSFVMNHIVHHRGQLSVYLRLNDIPVPSIYGPSADVPMF